MNLICEAPTEAAAERTGPVRIWFVDDNERIRHTVATAVGAIEPRFCFEREFSSPEGLLDALTIENPPDVILLDIQMGPYCGLDVIRPIKRVAPSTRVLMLTSLGSPEAKARAAREGASDFLLKCCPPPEIHNRILAAMFRDVACSIELPPSDREFSSSTASQGLPKGHKHSLAASIRAVALRLLLGDMAKMTEH